MLFAQFVVPPVIGAGNNSYFSATYGVFHLTMPVPEEVRFADTQYQFDPQVDRRRLVRKLGEIDSLALLQVDEAIKAAFGLSITQPTSKPITNCGG